MTPKNWNEVKGRIIAVDGSLTNSAAKLGCSTQAIRKAFEGECPLVAQNMERRYGLTLGSRAVTKRKAVAA